MSHDQHWFGPVAPSSGLTLGGVGGVAAPVAGLPALAQQPVHRGDRAQVAALVQQGGLDAGRRQVAEPLVVEHVQDLLALGG
jgi:hypothetical protein